MVKYSKSIICYIGLMLLALVLVRYYPVQMEIASNAWDDDICMGIQCYFDMGDGFTEENSINTYQRNASNRAFILSMNAYEYEKALQIRINFKKYPEKLYEDMKSLKLDSIIFKKMGIPFFNLTEFSQDVSFPVDAIWLESELKVNGPYPSIVLMENVVEDFQNSIRKINTLLIEIIAIIGLVMIIVWHKYLKGRVCDAERIKAFKEDVYVEGKLIQPFIFIVFFSANYFLMKRANIQGSFTIFLSLLVVAICVYLWKKQQDKRKIFSIVANYAIALFLVAMERQLEAFYYIPFVVVVIYLYGEMSSTRCGNIGCNVRQSIKKSDFAIAAIMMVAYYFILSYRIEANPRMTMDEMYALDVGGGFLHTGRGLKWNFVDNCSYGEYSRAWIFYAIVGLFYKLFGINIITARMVSVIFGVLFVMLVYFVLRNLLTQCQAVVATIAICFNSTIIICFRTARMYSMVLSVSIVLIYCCFNAIVQGNKFRYENSLTKWIKNNFDYNIKYLAATIILLVVSYIIHMNTIILVPGFAVFIIIQAVNTKERKYIIATRIILIGIALISFIFALINKFDAFYDNWLGKLAGFSNVITILSNPMESYFWTFLSTIAGISFGIGLTLVVLLKIIKEKDNKSVFYKWNVYALTIELTVLFVFVFMANHYAAERYAIFILPIVILVIVQGYMYLCSQYKSKTIWWIMVVIFLSFSAKGYIQECIGMYQGHPAASDYKKEAEIVANDATGKEISLYAIAYSSFYYQMFERVNIAKYVFEEETCGDTINIKDFFEFGLENNEGYVTMEQRLLKSYPLMTQLTKWMTKIGGEGFDNSNINVYKYHFILEDLKRERNVTFEKEVEYEGLSFRMSTNSDEKYLEVTVTDEELLQNKFLSVGVKFENEKEGYVEWYQLYTDECKLDSKYVIKLNPRMEDVEEYTIMDRVGVCDASFELAEREISLKN